MTMPDDASVTPVTEQSRYGPRRWYGDRATVVVIVAVALMLLGSLLARFVNAGGGGVTVAEVTIFGTNGHQISAHVYTPDGLSPESPAPGVAMWHGLNNQKEYMSNTALEMARRGFVVVNADQTGHGASNGANQTNGCAGPDTLAYLQGLPNVDPERIGLVGMSQGGFCAASAAALTQPDGYESIFFMESEPNPPGVFDVSPYLDFRNIAYNIGTSTELGVMIFVDKGSNANTSPVLLPMFGTEDPIAPNEVYGSVDDGTGRILYTPAGAHATSTDSTGAIGNAVDWMQRTLTDGEGLAPSNQIWPWKLVGTSAALLGAFLFVFAMGSVLLRTRAFAGLVRPVPEYRGLTGVGWWIGALITTALGPLLYLWVWKNMFFDPWLTVSSLWPQNFTNVYMVWAVIVGLIAWLLIALNHVLITRRQGATFAHYGLAEPGRGLDWSEIGRSALLVLSVLAPLYVLVTFVKGAWNVDFRAWVVTLQELNPARFDAFLAYLIPFAIFFVAQGILFAGFLRWRKGKAPLWQEMLVNAIVLTLGALVWLLILYVPLAGGGSIIFGSDPNTVTSSGLGGIYYIPLLVLWPLVACLYTYYYRKTGRVFVGSIMTTAFVVWSLTASASFGIWPIRG